MAVGNYILPFLIMTVISSVLGDSDDSAEQEATPTRGFQMNKERLRELWQVASLRGLVKAKGRAALKEAGRTEGILYMQCEKEAKTTVALAKCTVKAMDARDRAREQAKARDAENQWKPMFNITVKKMEKEKILYSTGGGERYYYGTKGRIGNPIRAQRKRIRWPMGQMRGIRKDEREQRSREESTEVETQRDQMGREKRSNHIDEAWEMFLEEERRKKKAESKNAGERAHPIERELTIREKLGFGPESAGGKNISEVPLRNIMGLPRKYSRKPRRKRKIETAGPASLGSRPAMDFPKLAAKYFDRIVGSTPSSDHLDKLRVIRKHFEKAAKVKEYYKLMNDENNRLFSRLSLPLDSRDPEASFPSDNLLDDVISMINQFVESELRPGQPSKLSIMSPRLLSIFPDKASRPHVLSPNVLSFQKGDGFFSLPQLFDIVTSDRRYQQLMLELVMDVSGAGNALEGVLTSIEPEMKEISEVQYPLIQEMTRHDLNWIRARRSFSSDQEKELEEQGFSFLENEQMELMYSNPKFSSNVPVNITELSSMSREQKELRLEQAIRGMARLGRPHWDLWGQGGRFSRAAVVEGGGAHGEHGERINGVEFRTLRPFAFANFVNHGVAMEAVTLSPHAFIGEIMTPEALVLHTLSPRAFIATVLSPAALVARILSPTALRAEVLSPRALYTWILSPESMVAEVLTPRFLEPRVLSPESLVIDVLSPGILAPHVLSSELVGVIILSPNILSPRIASEEKLLIEILSPHILGGPHSQEEKSHEILEIGAGPEEAEPANHRPEQPQLFPKIPVILHGGPHKHHETHSPEAEHHVPPTARDAPPLFNAVGQIRPILGQTPPTFGQEQARFIPSNDNSPPAPPNPFFSNFARKR